MRPDGVPEDRHNATTLGELSRMNSVVRKRFQVTDPGSCICGPPHNGRLIEYLQLMIFGHCRDQGAMIAAVDAVDEGYGDGDGRTHGVTLRREHQGAGMPHAFAL